MALGGVCQKIGLDSRESAICYSGHYDSERSRYKRDGLCCRSLLILVTKHNTSVSTQLFTRQKLNDYLAMEANVELQYLVNQLHGDNILNTTTISYCWMRIDREETSIMIYQLAGMSTLALKR